MPKKLRYALQIVIIVFILFFFTIYLVKNWKAVKEFGWEFSISTFILSVGLIFLNFLYLVFLWKYAVEKSGAELSYIDSFTIWFVSLFGRYIPGKVWQLAGMVWFLKKRNISLEKGSSSTIINYFLSVMGSSVLGSFILVKFLGKKAIILYGLLLLLFLFFSFPSIMQKTVNFFMQKILKKEAIEICIKTKDIVLLFLGHILSWMIYGVGFYLFLSSVIKVSFNDFSFLTSIFAASYLIGLVVVFLPGGIGAREGALAFFLSKIMPAEIAISISFLQRLWMTIPEVLGGIVALIILKRRKK